MLDDTVAQIIILSTLGIVIFLIAVDWVASVPREMRAMREMRELDKRM